MLSSRPAERRTWGKAVRRRRPSARQRSICAGRDFFHRQMSWEEPRFLEIVDSERFAVSYSIAQMGSEIKGSGFRVSSWGVLSLDYMRKRFSGFSGFKGGGTAHKKIEAPRSIDGGDARRQYLSHQSLATSHLRLLIPSH